MSTINKILIVLALIGTGTAAWAFSVSPQVGGGIGQSDGGISVTGAAPGPPPIGCSGQIDLSTGCVQPTLGVL